MTWQFQEIEKQLTRLADGLERLTLRGGPYDGHLMVVAKNATLEDAAIDLLGQQPAHTRPQQPSPWVSQPLELVQEAFLPANYTECWEVVTTHRTGMLPRRTDAFATEEAALAFFNGQKQKHGIHVELVRSLRIQVTTHVS